MNDHRTVRRTAAVAAAGALLGAAAALSLGAALGQSGRPAGRPKPTPEQVQAETAQAMQALNQFVGRWDVTGQSFDENGNAVGQFAGSSHWMFVLEENFLMGETVLQNGNYVLDQVDYIGYSPGLDKYTHVMLTELDKSMIYQHGEWQQDVGAFVFQMAAPLDTPGGTPRSVGMQYAFGDAGIDVTMTMQSGAKPARTVRMRFTRSTQPAAPTGPGGMPVGGGTQVAYRQGDPARMRAEMQQAMAQVTAQRQAVQQYFGSTNDAWDSQLGQAIKAESSRGMDDQTRDMLRGGD